MVQAKGKELSQITLRDLVSSKRCLTRLPLSHHCLNHISMTYPDAASKVLLQIQGVEHHSLV
jgi:hypothetical protein